LTAPTVDRNALIAEFLDLRRIVHGADLKPPLPPLSFAPDLPLLDLGAGTGISTIALAMSEPASSVYAVEQSRTSRSHLLGRLAGSEDLRRRVTVVAGDVLAVDLPPVWGGALAIHLVCQLSQDERLALWRLLASRLAPGAAAVIDRHYGPSPTDEQREESLSESIAVGENEYEYWFAASASRDGFRRVRSTYRLCRGGAVLWSHVDEREMAVVVESDVLAELAEVGLVGTPIGDHHLQIMSSHTVDALP
jgi:SAM-dependent methyltransferase